MKDLFSVAIITFQQRYLLEDCLKSIFKQTYENIELIICDDNSCDFSIDEISNYVAQHKGSNIKNVIIYQHPTNVGTSANCQKALELASGKYIKFQAGDDMLKHEKALSHMAELFKEESNNVIVSRAQACTFEGSLMDAVYPLEGYFANAMTASPEQLFSMIGTEPWGAYVCAPAVFFRKEYLDGLGGFDLKYKYTEDWPLWLKICERGDKLTYVDEITTIYRMGGISNDLSYVNVGLGKEHYNECVALLQDYVLPKLHNRSIMTRLRCWCSIQSVKARIVKETQWALMSLLEKTVWKLKNSPFILLSTMYYLRNHPTELNINFEKKFLLVMAFSFYFNLTIISEQFSKLIWSLGFLLGMLVVIIKCCKHTFFKFLRIVLNRRIMRRGDQI